ncbi:pimeloyl-ACP methyl ester carboxylesterase [Actinocrispum wychmicini]|uniref:Pimeloyl-ACP methyl ester carboxylesterase n=1 Tax=Actinocrispum wychmicini TaxID=1213861 RepID=A0A4R2J702_9PSEU|nr:pimeloyl-ACP methyl ester carboxylesterase [Actinocrispum wychmicini]
MALPDGRRMGYAVFGAPAGQPCLVVPGYSASRQTAGWAFPGADLRRHGIRLVAVDRPGYGLSTPHPGAGFTAWASDAVALIDHLSLGRVSVIALSMGTGPALALAAKCPSLVADVTVLGGMAPLDERERFAPASRGDALYWRLARHFPWLLRRMCAMSASAMAKSTPDRPLGRVERQLPSADLEVFQRALSNEDARTAFVADVAESCRQGGAAMADDLLSYSRPWDFDIADITVPVHIWHGLNDPKVPVAMGHRLADRIPGATAEFVPGGHFAALDHTERILTELTH